MRDNKEFACAENCSLRARFEIPNPDVRNGSVFSATCKDRVIAKTLGQKLFPAFHKSRTPGKVDFAVERRAGDRGNKPHLICGVERGGCENSIPLNAARFELKTVPAK